MPQDGGEGGGAGHYQNEESAAAPEVELWHNSSQSWLRPSRVDSTFVCLFFFFLGGGDALPVCQRALMRPKEKNW